VPTAGTVDATVFRTGATDERELLFQGLPGAMDADCGVCGGDVGLDGECLEAAAFEIDIADNFAVSRLHRAEHIADALADDLVGLRIGLRFGGQFLRPALEGSVFGGAMAVVIDDGVAQDAVEPRDGRLFAAQGGGLFERAGVCALQDVLRGGEGFDAPVQKAEKLLSLKRQVGDGRCRHGVCEEVWRDSPHLSGLFRCFAVAIVASAACATGTFTVSSHMTLLLSGVKCPNNAADA
jgi:hypothetical protein